jgi:hypothetical protein
VWIGDIVSEVRSGWRKLLLGAGLGALAVAGLMVIGVAMEWWHGLEVRTRWPRVSATITESRVAKRLRKRLTTYVYFAECGVTFDTGKEKVRGGFESRGAYYERRPVSWGNPGIEELRAWVAQHPAGSPITVRYDPSWPPTVEPEPIPAIFDWHSTVLVSKIAEIAAIVGAALMGLFWVTRPSKVL